MKMNKKIFAVAALVAILPTMACNSQGKEQYRQLAIAEVKDERILEDQTTHHVWAKTLWCEVADDYSYVNAFTVAFTDMTLYPREWLNGQYIMHHVTD